MAPIRLWWCVWLGVGVPAQAQTSDATSLAAAAIRDWSAAFERGQLGPRGTLRAGAGLQPSYVVHARRGGFVRERDEERITHLDLLQKLLLHAERHPNVDLADAVLDVAATRLEGAFLDHDAMQLREAGHQALLRMDHPGVWFFLARTAAGGTLPWAKEPDELDKGPVAVVVGPGRRVAALRLLAQKNLPVSRFVFDAALRDADPRVRLAAAEALDQQRKPETLGLLRMALAGERHPVVAQALVRGVHSLLREHGPSFDADRREAALAACVDRLGMAGWRTDMDLLELLEQYPTKAAVPALIELLTGGAAPTDPVLLAVNHRASPLRADKAHELLRGMTGALLPASDVAGWRRFWRDEGERVAVPAVLPSQRPQTTQSQFFGVPLRGGAIGFLVDTSGSMGEAVGTVAAGGRARAATRLGVAKRELAQAVQAMDPNSSFLLWTFAGSGQSWTPTPVRAGRNSLRALTELLSRLRANGGTNLGEGLQRALQLDQVQFAGAAETRIDELFVLSDGEPTAGPLQAPEAILALVQAANQYAKVRIHCIYIGEGRGSDLLARLAEQNGGVYVQR
ncbi:MAG: VWA domain-containing protein [Planctomycetes bacterium]|nr:VWA domain-containing protein [Planctomycetota bacterium]